MEYAAIVIIAVIVVIIFFFKGLFTLWPGDTITGKAFVIDGDTIIVSR